MDEKDIHQIEQASQLLKEYFIPVLKSFYDGCIENGFDKEQAMELTKIQMKALMEPNKTGLI